jgi:hypothetical protein
MALFGLDQLVRNSRGEVFAAASVGDRKQSANCSLRPLRHHLQRAHAFSHSLDPFESVANGRFAAGSMPSCILLAALCS